MDCDVTTPRPVCAKEALDLLNCAADPSFDRDKCLQFLDVLRSCILQKKVKRFLITDQTHQSQHDEVSTDKGSPR